MTPDDPLFSQQWYLRNTGQNGGTAGKDIDAVAAWAMATGAGVKIVVNDTGIDFTNPDIAPNYDAADSKSLDAPTNSGYPNNTDNLSGTNLTDLAHGTAVAGLIAAAGNDDYGIIGVAFDATVAAFRVLNTAAEAASPFTAIAAAFTNSKNFDVANNSWEESVGLSDSVFSTDPNVQTAINALLDAATNGRNGLGTINVFAAGNGFQTGDDTNFHAFQSSINVVTVAALDDNGTVNAPASLGGRYSNTGASILVSAPGTGIVSDDIVGAAGFSSGDQATGLNGTSFAAPLVTGVIALMLQANPNLGLRDVQEILAYTAIQTDPTNASWSINDATNWNGGGLHVSDDYGFGLVDARAAVALAQSWTLQQTLANRTIDTVAAQSIGAIPTSGATFNFSVPAADLLTLQWVRVQVQLDFTTLDDLKIVLISPDGAQSILLDHPYAGTTAGQGSFNTSVQLSTDQFWGQQSVGTWKLSITNAATGENASGQLIASNLVLVGDQPAANHAYIYTDEYATLVAADPARGILVDTSGGLDTINIAAVSGNCTLNLAAGGACTIDGAPLTIGASTVVKAAIGGSGNDTLIANNLGDVLQAGDGTTMLVGGTGNDTLIGGTGSDDFAGGAGSNMITGGTGANTLDYSAAPAAVTVNLANGTAQNGYGGTDSFTNIQTIVGSPFNDTFMGGSGSHAVAGGAGVNVLDYAAAPAAVTVNFATGVAQNGYGGTDNFTNIQTVDGSAFNDVFTVGGGAATIGGGGGHDEAIFQGNRSDYAIALNGDGSITVTDSAAGRNGVAHLLNVEDIHFANKVVFVENSDNANLARLYSAALAREPDIGGLNYWEGIYDNGVPAAAKTSAVVGLADTIPSGLTASIAQGFVDSTEFQMLYGNPTDMNFLTELYHNALGRAPDPVGLSYWEGQLAHGTTRAEVLVGFAESTENIAATAANWLFPIPAAAS